jgi:hypothetical protein
VEYFYYVVLILALLAGCLFALRIPGRKRLNRQPEELAERAKQRRKREQEKASARDTDQKYRHAIIERELQKVLTPWGWPGSELHGEESGHGAADPGKIGGHGGLRRWVDHLIAEKRTIEDETYRKRRQDSLRALLEDRYGRAVKPSEMTYRKVKPPLLRDPSLPYDQMDNFPSGKAEQIASGLDRQPDEPHGDDEVRLRRTGSLREIKTPWGW